MRRVQFLTIVVLALAAPLPANAQHAVPAIANARIDAATTIQGNAFTDANAPLVGGVVRLRDARTGRVIEKTVTDKAGLFAFRSLEPGSYVVELMGPDQSILGASGILNINAGETVSAIVKMPFHIPAYAGVLGHSVQSAAVVIATAAAAGVLATEVAGEQKSPRR